jgi:hypothetical protein
MHHASPSPNFASIRHAGSDEAATVVRMAVEAYSTTAWLAQMPALTPGDVKIFLLRAGNGALLASIGGESCGAGSLVRV